MSRVYSERLNQIQRTRLAGRERAAMHYRNRVAPVLSKVVLKVVSRHRANVRRFKRLLNI